MLGAESSIAWQAGDGCRTATVKPTGAKAGFTRLVPEFTSIFFGNHLPDAFAATNRILENGSGVALGDVDGDGRCDIYFCRLDGSNVLYRNSGDWKFEDVTAAANVACSNQFSTGAVFADLDGDGDLDLLVNSIGGGTRCFFNDGRAHFAENRNSGLIRQFGATSMALADIDGDGDLDLYVTNYRTTNYKDAPPGVNVDARRVNGKVIVTPEDRFTALVVKKTGEGVTIIEKGEPDILYLNDGKGRFSAVPWTGGAFLDEEGKPLAEPPRDWGLSAMFRDINGDGAPDIYVCNDFFYSRDRVWINDGKGHFRALPKFAMRNMSMSSMAVDFADINRDGHDDFFVVDMLSRSHTSRHRQRANILKGELMLPTADPAYCPEVLRNTLCLNRGNGTYTEIGQHAGVHASEWTWSVSFLDVDLDGYEDILLATGNLHDVLDMDSMAGIPADQTQQRNSLLRFPRLEVPNLAFRNRGDLKFEDVSHAWGFDSIGISHGMALADLDNDGDLDVVINDMNSAAAILRNDSPAPRVAVRLKGLAPNIQGIGAKIVVRGGPMKQEQQILCGGRYLSGDDPMRVFAAGDAKEVSIEVTWRNGRKSIIERVAPNTIVEVAETGAKECGNPKVSDKSKPLFEDVSSLLAHQHVDEAFDDFQRQPLLSRKLSQLGPGVAWHDIDGDGWEDLIIGTGKGGRLTVFRNDGRGGFTSYTNTVLSQTESRDQSAVLGWKANPDMLVLLTGSANYEDGQTNRGALRIFDLKNSRTIEAAMGRRSSAGPLALADIDADGDLDLFIGGRVIPGRYPEPANSALFRNDGGRFRMDVENSKKLIQVGLISGAVFSDIDGDGDSDLVLACEWGPIKIFRNEKGDFTDVTKQVGFAKFTGWWNGVTAGDFDSDGRMDIAASNWGTNTRYLAEPGRPMHIYYGDFNESGGVDLMEGYTDPGLNKIVPWPAFDTTAHALPFVQAKFQTYRQFGSASIAEILDDRSAAAGALQAVTLQSTVFFNRGDHFEAIPLPAEAQFAPAFGITVADFDGDGSEDLFLSQNFFGCEIEMSRCDGGLGVCLLNDGKGVFRAMSVEESGIRIYGEQRGTAVCDYDRDGRSDLVVAQNSSSTKLYRNVAAKPGLRVRLTGTTDNPNAIGARIRLMFDGGSSPMRELHAGSGYWSEDSAVQVMSNPNAATHIRVRWPGGDTTTSAIPPSARDITVQFSGAVSGVR
jgi:enediyne biosynthesis protein E4